MTEQITGGGVNTAYDEFYKYIDRFRLIWNILKNNVGNLFGKK